MKYVEETDFGLIKTFRALRGHLNILRMLPVHHLILLLLFVSEIHSQSGTDLSNLKTKLFTTDAYNTEVRPVSDQSHTVTVSVDFALVGLNSFSDTDQKLTTTGYLTIKWTDELLTWTTATYNGLSSMLIPQNEVWKPDLTLDNGMESKQALGQTFIQVKVDNTGQITWSPYEVFETSCSVDVVHFPFDKQKCDIKFISWMYTQTEVTLQHGTTGFYKSNFEKNGKWEIESMTSSTTTSNGKTVLVFTLNLNRKSSFYILFLALPAVLLSILNIFVFVLPASSGEKVGYCLAVFLSYALFYTILSESLPKNSDNISTVGAYLFFMMFLSTLASIVTIIELRIFNKTSMKVPKAVVKFVKFVLHRKCLCTCKSDDHADLDNDIVDEGWTRVISQWVDCTWGDFVDALDFVLFWVFLVVTVVTTIIAFIFASSHIKIFS